MSLHRYILPNADIFFFILQISGLMNEVDTEGSDILYAFEHISSLLVVIM
jgi:hypothetical protein